MIGYYLATVPLLRYGFGRRHRSNLMAFAKSSTKPGEPHHGETKIKLNLEAMDHDDVFFSLEHPLESRESLL